MILHYCCFPRIMHFLSQLFSCFTIYKTPIKPLPDNVVFDILGRLPPEHVSICRRVCKKWLELTSTNDFAHTHLRRNRSYTEKILVLQCSSNQGWPIYESTNDNLFILNKKTRGKRIFTKMLPDLNIPSKGFPVLYGSCNGLLLFVPPLKSDRYYLFNPTTHERINIRCYMGVLCGFFFHPSNKEYIFLYRRNTVDIDGMLHYFLFNPEAKSLRKVSTFPYYSTTVPVYSNGALCWIIHRSKRTCKNFVMAFNVETEVFSCYPHPGKKCKSQCTHTKTCLVEIRGQLIFCNTLMDYIDMWDLEDNENCIWVKRYSVHLDWDLRLYPFESDDGLRSEGTNVRIFNGENGEILLSWIGRGLFVYNLDEKKVKKINLKGMKVKGKFESVSFVSSYVKSLVSLKVSKKYPNSGKFPTYGHVTVDLE